MPKRRSLIPRMWKLLETGNIYLINCQFYDVNSLIKVFDQVNRPFWLNAPGDKYY